MPAFFEFCGWFNGGGGRREMETRHKMAIAGSGLIVASVACAEHRAPGHQHRTGAGYVAEHQADEKRRATVPDQAAQSVAMGDVA